MPRLFMRIKNDEKQKAYDLALAFIMAAVLLFLALFKASTVLQKAFLFAIIVLFSMTCVSQHYEKNTIAKAFRVASWALMVIYGIYLFRSGMLEYPYLVAWGIILLLQVT